MQLKSIIRKIRKGQMELGILKDIVIIFALSTPVNLIFTRIKVPTVVGYLLTGIIAGPYLLSLVDARHEIELMAEIGVVLLLFTIGMEFSLQHLLKDQEDCLPWWFFAGHYHCRCLSS